MKKKKLMVGLFLLMVLFFTQVVSAEFFNVIARRGSVNELKTAIKNGANVNSRYSDTGQNALMETIRYRKGSTEREMVNLLIENGINLNSRDEDGKSALMYAIEESNLGLINTLIDSGSKIKTVDRRGHTLLWYAAVKVPNFKAVQKLVESGLSIKNNNFSENFLIKATKNGTSFKILKYLIDKGIKFKKEELLFASAEGDNLELTKYLISNNVEVNKENKEGITPLMVAASNSSIKTAKYLIKNGANVNERDKNGMTPLMHAGKNSSKPKIFTILLDNKANPKLKDNRGKLAIDYAFRNNKYSWEKPLPVWRLNDLTYN